MKTKENVEQIIAYLEDSSNFKSGKAEKVYIPEDETEVIYILKKCAKEKIPVTISAGGTGNVAGRIPLEGVVLSTEELNRIVKIDVENKIATLQSGVVVNNFIKELEKFNLFYPPFPTERNAFIGGNVATNASGEYSFRFGPTRDYVRRIKMVLTTGDILEIRRGEIFEKNGFIDYEHFRIQIPSYRTPDVKCSAGYYIKEGMDAIDLIIGSEGTLGVITEVDVALIDILPERFIMIMFFNTDDDIVEVVTRIKGYKDKLNIYSLEFFDCNSLGFLGEFEFVNRVKKNLDKNCCAIYIEAEKKNLDLWLELAESINCIDTVVAESFSDYEKLVRLRYKLPENINSYFKRLGTTKIAVDAAVPEGKFKELYDFYKNIMLKYKEIKMVLFGHIGENHLHFNLFPENDKQKQLAEEIYIESIRKSVSLGGTGFAEHGIGKLKSKYLYLMYGEQAIYEMAKIKKTFDPYCILGLGNIIPKEILSC
ncbi:MAG: FAD-binding oxidoreductase [Endomicrobia bacterium]|nr:FAD-binding oxidoreductase [Endomicrobiia bacterium]MDW8056328.1 FAD-binding oxidoreductase [Elusimicrobiota bacterium]